MYPEITCSLDGKEFKSIDYGWEGTDFIVVDKETKISHLFKGAYISGISECQSDDDIITIPVGIVSCVSPAKSPR